MRLKIGPELWIDAEPVAETERGVSGYLTLPRYNLRNPIGRHVNLARKLGLGHAETVQLVCQNNVWVYGYTKHGKHCFHQFNAFYNVRK